MTEKVSIKKFLELRGLSEPHVSQIDITTLLVSQVGSIVDT